MKTRRPLLTTPPQLQRREAVRLQREVLATQPWVGLGGLVLSAVVFFALALGLGNTATSLLVLGPMTVFAVSGVAMIGCSAQPCAPPKRRHGATAFPDMDLRVAPE